MEVIDHADYDFAQDEDNRRDKKMPSTAQETFVVDSIGQYGPKVGGKNYNWSKKIPADQKNLVIPGKQITAEIYTSDGGAKYINKVLSASAAATAAPAITNTPAPAATAAQSISGGNADERKVDWDVVNRGKTACVLYEAALQSMALANFSTSSVDDYLALVEKVVKRGVAFVFDDKNLRGE